LRASFIRDYTYRGYLPEVKRQISDLAMNGSGIRDTARMLKVSPTTVIGELKNHRHLESVNQAVLEQTPTSTTTALIVRVDEAEMDEM
jgi:transposase-like protein